MTLFLTWSRFMRGVDRPEMTSNRTELKIAQIFPKICAPLQSFRHQKGDIIQASDWGPTNISRHRKKFGRHGDLAPGIYARPLYTISPVWHMTSIQWVGNRGSIGRNVNVASNCSAEIVIVVFLLLPASCHWNLHSVTDVSALPVDPIFKGSAEQDGLTLEDGTDKLTRNVGN